MKKWGSGKYPSKKCEYVNKQGKKVKMDSKIEFERYLELEQLLIAGKIKNLQTQVAYEIFKGFTDPAGKKRRKIEYICDSRYFDVENDCMVIEDVKSKATAKDDVYRIKKKMIIYKLMRIQEETGIEHEFREVIR